MLCSTPYRTAGNLEFGCGKCDVCRINKSRHWQGRLLLESQMHDSSIFVTLTYDDFHLPADNSLKPRDLQLFLKRLRKNHETQIRFFACGEYGTQGGRPHYHLALFGSFRTESTPKGLSCAVIEKSWTKGFVHVGVLEPSSAAYIVKYATKGLYRRGDPALESRHPEFIRMSTRPGIGATAVKKMENSLTERKGAAFLSKNIDVPTEFIVDGGRYLLGRYLSNVLRKELGRDEKTPTLVNLARSARKLQQERKGRELVRKQHAHIARQRVSKLNKRAKL